MAMVVKNNMTAVNTLNILNKNSSALSKSLQKVSSGMKINSAADDASGYAISERMRVQIRSLDQANQNTQNGSSMMKVAEGAVSSTVEILKTLKEKAVNAANDSNTDSDRQTIQKELDQSIDQINDNANVTFNGKYLVDGSKNTIGNATYTALSNQSLSEDTKATTKLTDLAARNGDSLEIHDTDKVTVSYVQGGKTYSTTFSVKNENGDIATLQDIFNKAEDIDKDSKIFADASNKSVSAALKADDPTFAADTVKSDIEAKEAALRTATTNKDFAAKVLGESTEKSIVKTDVDAWNAAAQKLNELAGGNAVGVINVDANATAADYLDAVSKDTTFLKAANSGGYTDIATLKTKVDAAEAIDATATATNQASTFAEAAIAKLDGGTDAEKVIIAAIKEEASKENASAASVKALLTSMKTEVGTLKSTADDMKDTAAGKPGKVLTTDGTTATPATGSKYADYSTAKTAYDTAKAAYDTVAGAKLLTGKTVGLAASDDTVTTASGQNAITITANKEGIGGQISGLNISITDSEANVKKSANAALDAFEETVRAQNKSDDNAISLQVGAKANQSIKVGLTDMRAEALGLMGEDGTKLNISTQSKANAAINVLDNAIQKALDQQTTIGSVESRLEYTSSNLTTASENVQASESTIRDADMAKEMTEYTKNNVLLQAAQSMLAQANQSSSNVLSLLQ